MISRVAEHCFWLARYLERAENTARVLEVNHTLLLDFHVPTDQQWRPLLIISGIHDFAREPSADAVQGYMTWDEENACSIVRSVAAARENARVIREVISADMWERINAAHLWLHSPAARAGYGSGRTEFYAQVRRINQLVHGIADGTMSHGEAWEFFRFGAYLERASQTARILDVKYHTLLPRAEDVGTPVDNAHWVAILTSCSGYEPFHKRPRLAAADPGAAVAEFLIFDPQFPRSVRFCLGECRRAVRVIGGPDPAGPTEAERKLDALTGWLDARAIGRVIRDGLHEGLTHVVNSVHDIGAAAARSYFDAPDPCPVPPPTPTQSQTQR